MYAMVRRLSLVNRVPLYLETHSGFDGDYFQRSYGLNIFNIAGCEIAGARPSKLSRQVTIAASRILPFSRRWYFCESDGAFDSRYLDLQVHRPITLEGYWQDERYFADIRLDLKHDLTFLKAQAEETMSLAREMRRSESVAVHVRQLHSGPPGSAPPRVVVEGLPSEYYRAAIQKIRERLRQPRFYLFSDSPRLCTIPGVNEDVTRVQNTGDDAQYSDLYLMSQCRHYVLANSTFSWWGAWLGRTSESIVISPVMREWGQLVRLPDEWRAIEWQRRT